MARIDDRLAALVTWSATQLRDEWQRLWRTPPPRLQPDLLRHIIGHRLQERQHGGLSPHQRRSLLRIAQGAGSATTPRLKPGTRLLRSWHGRTLTVLVTDEGYLFEDRVYTSLSAIAREVTGAAWSGPRFFGLTAPRTHTPGVQHG